MSDYPHPDEGLVMLRCEECGDEFDSSQIDCPACGSSHVSYASEDARRANEFNRPRGLSR